MNNLVITKLGQSVIADLIAGKEKIKFTKLKTSAKDYSGITVEDLTEIEDVVQEVDVSKVEKKNETYVDVYAAIDNATLEDGYYVRAIGLYAEKTDGKSILYGVCTETENPDYLPVFGGTTSSGISYKITTVVSNSEQVNIEINPAATPTIEQVEAIDERVTAIESDYVSESDLTVKLEEKVDKEDGKGLSKNDFTDEYKGKIDGLSTELGKKGNTFMKQLKSQTISGGTWTTNDDPNVSDFGFKAEISCDGVTTADWKVMSFYTNSEGKDSIAPTTFVGENIIRFYASENIAGDIVFESIDVYKVLAE